MSPSSEGALWRRTSVGARIEAISRWRDAIVREHRALAEVWARTCGVTPRAALEHEVVALAAALDELEAVGPSVLQPAMLRRWLGGESIRARIEPGTPRVLWAGADAAPAEVLAWAACVLAAGGAVRLQADDALIPAFDKALEGLAREGSGVPLERAWVGAQREEDPRVTDAFGGTESAIEPAGRRSPVKPALAWIDDAEDVVLRCELLLEAARYRGGRLRGALRAVFGRSASLEPLWTALAQRAGADPSSASLFLDGVRVTRGEGASSEREQGPALAFEALEESAYVARALEGGGWAAACGLGRDEDRVRSLAARCAPDVIFVNATPASGLGGILRAEFDGRRWLQDATRWVPVVSGPTPWLARTNGTGASEVRATLTRTWARICLGRHGLGGSIEDLG